MKNQQLDYFLTYFPFYIAIAIAIAFAIIVVVFVVRACNDASFFLEKFCCQLLIPGSTFHLLLTHFVYDNYDN